MRGLFKMKNNRIIKVLWLAVFCVLAFSLSPLSSAQAATWYVDAAATGTEDGTSWIDAYLTIQEAIDDPLTVADDEIWVKEGTYTLTTQINVVKSVSIYGGFSALITDPGWLTRDWEAYGTTVNGNNAVFHCFYITTDATIDGFTITGGLANGGGIDSQRGAGIKIINCSPTIVNCIISSNHADLQGGGIWIRNSPTSRITNCTFSGNSAGIGGGIYLGDANTMITRCNFSVNSADNGGAIFNDGASPIISNCTFWDNFVNSGGTGGAIRNGSSDPKITNCLFSGNNTDNEGGGIFNSTSNPTLTNCTFTNNSADSGGAIYNSGSSPTITNCILWGDTAVSGDNEIHDSGSLSIPVVTYCDVQGGYTGTGNIGANLLLDDPLLDVNLNILQGSPCIDAGNNEAVPADTEYDLGGNPRFTDDPATADTGAGTAPIVDMGAYEYFLTHTVTFVEGSNGSIIGELSQIVTHGGNCTEVTADPDPNYHFDAWTDDYTGTDNPLTVEDVTEDMTITATFAIDTYTITVTPPGPNGTIAPGSGEVDHNSTPTYTITPAANYHIVDVTVDGSIVSAPGGSYTFAPVTAPHTIAATFAIDTYTITVTPPGPNGTIAPGSGEVDHNSTPTYTITPAANYHIVDVTVDGSIVSAPGGSYTFAPVTAPHTIAATFAIDTYTITVNSGPNGSTDMDGTHTINHGDTLTIDAIPDSGYKFTVWSDDASGSNDPLEVTVTGPMNITANFALLGEFTVTFIAGANGGINGTLVQNVTEFGSTYDPVEAIPVTGYDFNNWTDTGSFTSTDNPLTVTDVTSNMTIIANFDPIPYTLTMATGGTGDGILDPIAGNHDYGYNSIVPITATANGTSVFVGWSGDVADPDAETTTVTITGDMTVTATFASDGDSDGISDNEEDGAPNGGDGNDDGTDDSLQNNVTSLLTYDGQDYVTIESASGTLNDVEAIDNPSPSDSPSGTDFNYGLFDFTITGLGAGGSTTVTLYLPAGAAPTKYYKYGQTPLEQFDHWYEFDFDGQTGAVINGNVITLDFEDGLRGDDDLNDTNGTIVEPGGPAFASASSDSTGGGGGGCFIATTSSELPDITVVSMIPYLALMLLFFVIGKAAQRGRK